MEKCVDGRCCHPLLASVGFKIGVEQHLKND